jgi:hypothetical protein
MVKQVEVKPEGLSRGLKILHSEVKTPDAT